MGSVASTAAVEQAFLMEQMGLASWLCSWGYPFYLGYWQMCAPTHGLWHEENIGHTWESLSISSWDSHVTFPFESLVLQVEGDVWGRACSFGACPQNLDLWCFVQTATFSFWGVSIFCCFWGFFPRAGIMMILIRRKWREREWRGHQSPALFLLVLSFTEELF